MRVFLKPGEFDVHKKGLAKLKDIEKSRLWTLFKEILKEL